MKPQDLRIGNIVKLRDTGEIDDAKLIPIPEPINPFLKLPIDILRRMYKDICEEYRRRLCEIWGFDFGDSWWPSERIGEELCVDDWCVLDMPEIRYCVENNVSSDAFSEYWQFVEDEAYNGQDRPRINFYSWFALGARPEMLND